MYNVYRECNAKFSLLSITRFQKMSPAKYCRIKYQRCLASSLHGRKKFSSTESQSALCVPQTTRHLRDSCLCLFQIRLRCETGEAIAVAVQADCM